MKRSRAIAGKFLFVFDGQTCPYHRHALKHETFFVVKGRIRMLVGDGERVMEEGERLAMPPGVVACLYRTGPGAHSGGLDALAPARQLFPG